MTRGVMDGDGKTKRRRRREKKEERNDNNVKRWRAERKRRSLTGSTLRRHRAFLGYLSVRGSEGLSLSFFFFPG